ncbi:unnamed protein product [Lupinus luteus]|uniref:Uncharacterized protein n=1 Tax=Lupinus luteus TaxID=3873 RepID=A0AAV1W8C9_LUPLU
MYKIWEHNKRNTQQNTKVVVDPSTRLFGMIPNTPSSCFNLNHHLQLDHVAVGSPINRVSPSSSSNPFSIDGSPSPYSAQFINDHCSTKPWLDSESSRFDDDLKLSEYFARMNVTDANNNDSVPFFNGTGTTPLQHFCNAGVSVPKGCTFGSQIESYDWNTNQVCYHVMEHRKKQGSQFQSQNPSFISNPFLYDHFMGSHSHSQSQPFGMDVKKPFTFSQSQMMHPKIALNANANVPLPPSHCVPATHEMAMAKEAEYPQRFSQRRNGIDPVAYACDNSFIPQGRDMKHCIENGHNSMRCYKKSYGGEVYENNDNNTLAASDFSLRLLLNFYSLAEDTRGTEVD